MIITIIGLALLIAFVAYIASLLSTDIDNDLQECLGCGDNFDIEIMVTDSDSNWFCQQCYDELSPLWEAEYKELVERGEIDPEYD